MTRGALLVLVVLLLGVGCSVGPDYVTPSMETPATYKEIEGWTVAAPQDGEARGPWWTAFGDAELDALVSSVRVSNQNVAVAEAQFRQARALVGEARSAYFPQIGISAGLSGFGGRAGGTSTTSGSAAVTPGARTTSSAGVSVGSSFFLSVDVSWEPDLWGRVRRTVEGARASAQASAADLVNVQLSLQAELVADYFQARTLDAQKRLLDETVAGYRRSLELTRNRYAAGVASRADVAQAETQLASTQAQATDVGVQRAQLEHAIATLMGRPASSFSLPSEPLAALPPPVPVGVPSELLQRRPDIAGTERRVAAANAQIGVAKAAYFPTLTLGGSAGLASSDIGTWFSWPSRFWAVGPSVSETIFDGGLRHARSDEARAAFEAAVATYRQSVLGAFQEVEDNIAALRILEQEALTQEQAVRTAQEALTIVTNQYRAGTTSYLDVITSQTIALNNARTAVDILGRRMAASVVLIKALGGGWNATDLPSDRDVTQRS